MVSAVLHVSEECYVTCSLQLAEATLAQLTINSNSGRSFACGHDACFFMDCIDFFYSTPFAAGCCYAAKHIWRTDLISSVILGNENAPSIKTKTLLQVWSFYIVVLGSIWFTVLYWHTDGVQVRWHHIIPMRYHHKGNVATLYMYWGSGLFLCFDAATSSQKFECGPQDWARLEECRAILWKAAPRSASPPRPKHNGQDVELTKGLMGTGWLVDCDFFAAKRWQHQGQC